MNMANKNHPKRETKKQPKKKTPKRQDFNQAVARIGKEETERQ